MKPYIVSPENALRIAGWIRDRKGIAIWESIDLSNPSFSVTTPVISYDGQPTPKPSWKVANTPARIITDMADVVVSVDREVKRFHVGVRRGSQGLSLKVTDGGSRRIRKEVAKAGEGAYHVFDYETQDAVIMVPESQMPLTEYLKTREGKKP